MSKFLANINSNSKPEDSQIINWEIIKNREYNNNSLSKIINLYIIKVYRTQNNELGNKHLFSTLLVRINIANENVFLNKLPEIEIIKEIFPYKFNSKRKSNLSRLQDLYNHLCHILNFTLSKDIEENLIKEYKEATNLFKMPN